MAKAFFAHGTTFSFGGALVGGLRGIGLPEEEKDRVDITTHDSGGDREYVPGLRDGGTVSLTALVVPGNVGQDALDDNYAANPAPSETCVITTPPGVPEITWTFQGFVESRGGGMPHDDAGEATWTIRITGQVVKESEAS